MLQSKAGETYIAVNTHLLLNIIMFCIFLGLSISCAAEGSPGPAIFFAVLALLPVFVLLISPLFYVFTEEQVKIVYPLGQKEIIPWQSVRSISLSGSWVGSGGHPCYHLAYPHQDHRPFYVNSEISKTRKTKKLIKRYYEREIG